VPPRPGEMVKRDRNQGGPPGPKGLLAHAAMADGGITQRPINPVAQGTTLATSGFGSHFGAFR
jgi:hypothetical protein